MTLAERIRKAPRTYIVGNGGSAANAEHISNDLQSCGVRAHTLNSATLTAWANDFGYEFVFSKWIILHGEPGDMLIALSGSGKSPNILNAIEAAKIMGMDVHQEFGAAQGLNMQAAEERQITLGHEVMLCLKSRSPA